MGIHHIFTLQAPSTNSTERIDFIGLVDDLDDTSRQ